MNEITINFTSILKEPVEHVISEFGGIAELSAAINCCYPTVYMWNKRCHLPAKYHAVILKEAQTRSLDINAHDLIQGRHIFLSSVLRKLIDSNVINRSNLEMMKLSGVV
jgi:hypothetical protein